MGFGVRLAPDPRSDAGHMLSGKELNFSVLVSVKEALCTVDVVILNKVRSYLHSTLCKNPDAWRWNGLHHDGRAHECKV